MWTTEERCGRRAVAPGEAMEGYLKVQRPGELHSEETLARYAPGKPDSDKDGPSDRQGSLYGCHSCVPLKRDEKLNFHDVEAAFACFYAVKTCSN